MGVLTKLFGDIGTVRFEAVSIDGAKYRGKIKVESWNNSKLDLEIKLKNEFFVQTGIILKEFTIIGFSKYN